MGLDLLAGAPSWLGGTLGSLVVDCSRRLGLQLWMTVKEVGGVHHLMILAKGNGEELSSSLRCASEAEALVRLIELGKWCESWAQMIYTPAEG